MRQAVKCRASRLCGAAAATALAAATLSVPARGQLLLGGSGPAEPRLPPPLDATLPTGAEQRTPPRPATPEEPAACSLRYAACVHRGAGVPEATALGWVDALDTAYGRLVEGLGLAPPLPDWDRGGSGAFDVYVLPGRSDLDVEIDALEVGRGVDSASAFCVAPAAAGDVERAAALCVGEAIALRLDAAETPFSRRGLATELWLATGRPSSEDARAVDDVQAHPERGILGRDRSLSAEGSALFFEYLEAAKGRGGPAAATLATYALSANPPSPVAFRFRNEPDIADVLRATFGPTPTDAARLFGDFALARAFVGSRDAEGRLPSLAWLGDFGRVRFEWSVEAKSLPRQLAPSQPIDPLGASYLWVSLGPEAEKKSFVFQADWEPPATFRWALALVSKTGALVRRLDAPFLERETHVERIVTDLSGAAYVLVAGTNLGGLGPSYPFDPDFEPFEPHGYTVTLALQ